MVSSKIYKCSEGHMHYIWSPKPGKIYVASTDNIQTSNIYGTESGAEVSLFRWIVSEFSWARSIRAKEARAVANCHRMMSRGRM